MAASDTLGAVKVTSIPYMAGTSTGGPDGGADGPATTSATAAQPPRPQATGGGVGDVGGYSIGGGESTLVRVTCVQRVVGRVQRVAGSV